MRHGAGGNALHLNHLIRRNHRHRGWNHISVEIRIGDVNEVAVGRNVGSRGEHAEAGVFDGAEISGAKFPERAFGTPVSLRHINELLVR